MVASTTSMLPNCFLYKKYKLLEEISINKERGKYLRNQSNYMWMWMIICFALDDWQNAKPEFMDGTHEWELLMGTLEGNSG